MPNQDGRLDLTRRETLGAGIAASAAFVLPSMLSLAGPAVTPALASAVSLTPEQEEGPYYVALERIRANVAAGQPGAPLHLTVTVLNSDSGAVLENAAVDIWQCNARGVYSDESVEHTLGETFLRGVQLTDAEGKARFLTT